MIIFPSKLNKIFIARYWQRLAALKKTAAIAAVIFCVLLSFLIYHISKISGNHIAFLETAFMIICLLVFAANALIAITKLFKKSDAHIIASPRFQLIPSQSLLFSLLLTLFAVIFICLPIIIAFHPEHQAIGYVCLAFLGVLFVMTGITLAVYIMIFLLTILIRKIHGKVRLKYLWKYLIIIFIFIAAISTAVAINARALSPAQMIQNYSLLPSSVPALIVYAEKVKLLYSLLALTATACIINIALLPVFDFFSSWFLEAWQDIRETWNI